MKSGGMSTASMTIEKAADYLSASAMSAPQRLSLSEAL